MNAWSEWLLSLDQKHGQVIAAFKYVVRTSGGLVWPVLYVCALAGWIFSWPKIVPMPLAIVLGAILLPIVWLYAIVWRHHVASWKTARMRECEQVQGAWIALNDALNGKDVWDKWDPKRQPPEM